MGWVVREVQEVEEVVVVVQLLVALAELAALREAMVESAAARHSPESIARCPRPEFVARLMLLPALKLPDCASPVSVIVFAAELP